MRPWIVAAVLPLIAACSADRGGDAAHAQHAAVAEIAAPSKETFALGSELGANGAVPQRAIGDSFSRGGEVYLSIDVASASIDQEVKVEWIDGSGRIVRRQESSVPEGARYVWFSSGPTTQWRRGPHRAVIIINGRSVSEKTFELS